VLPVREAPEVYIHEMPGGQFTNLKEQAAALGLGHRWPEVARCYADVNQLLGDIVKVTPSSKVVGDLAIFHHPRIEGFGRAQTPTGCSSIFRSRSSICWRVGWDSRMAAGPRMSRR